MRIDEQTGENGFKMMYLDFMFHHVLNNIPPEYEIVQVRLEELLSYNELTIEKIRTELNLKVSKDVSKMQTRKGQGQ